MLEYLTTYYTDFLEFTKSNPVAAGVVSLYGLGILTFLLKVVPTRVIRFIKYQFTTTLVLNNFDDVYYDFLEWVSKNNTHRFVRDFTFNRSGIYNGNEGDAEISIGYGKIFFFFNRRLFFMERTKEQSNNIVQTKETITVTLVGRSHKKLEELFKTIQKKEEDNWIDIKMWRNYYIKIQQNKRDLDTVVIDSKIKSELLECIDKFKSDKKWYVDNGVPHNLGIMFYGPSGTGKTSLIKALGSYYNMPIYLINIATVTDSSLQDALFDVPSNCIVAIEDIDTANLGKRDLKQTAVLKKCDNRDDPMENSINVQSDKDNLLSLGGVLNAIDGVATTEGRILIATTNDINSLDEALLREGRFDLKLEIGYMTDETMRAYLNRFYDCDFSDWHVNTNIQPCKVQKLVFDNRNNPDKVLEKIAYKA